MTVLTDGLYEIGTIYCTEISKYRLIRGYCSRVQKYTTVMNGLCLKRDCSVNNELALKAGKILNSEEQHKII